jgi:hypothetical protein
MFAFRHGNQLKKLALEETETRRHAKETYTKPLRGKEASAEEARMVSDFIWDFKKTFHPGTTGSEILLEHHIVQQHHDNLVPTKITEANFWQRYFYRCDKDRVRKELEKGDPAVLKERFKKLKEETTPSTPSSIVMIPVTKKKPTSDAAKQKGEGPKPTQGHVSHGFLGGKKKPSTNNTEPSPKIAIGPSVKDTHKMGTVDSSPSKLKKTKSVDAVDNAADENEPNQRRRVKSTDEGFKSPRKKNKAISKTPEYAKFKLRSIGQNLYDEPTTTTEVASETATTASEGPKLNKTLSPKKVAMNGGGELPKLKKRSLSPKKIARDGGGEPPKLKTRLPLEKTAQSSEGEMALASESEDATAKPKLKKKSSKRGVASSDESQDGMDLVSESEDANGKPKLKKKSSKRGVMALDQAQGEMDLVSESEDAAAKPKLKKKSSKRGVMPPDETESEDANGKLTRKKESSKKNMTNSADEMSIEMDLVSELEDASSSQKLTPKKKSPKKKMMIVSADEMSGDMDLMSDLDDASSSQKLTPKKKSPKKKKMIMSADEMSGEMDLVSESEDAFSSQKLTPKKKSPEKNKMIVPTDEMSGEKDLVSESEDAFSSQKLTPKKKSPKKKKMIMLAEASVMEVEDPSPQNVVAVSDSSANPYANVLKAKKKKRVPSNQSSAEKPSSNPYKDILKDKKKKRASAAKPESVPDAESTFAVDATSPADTQPPVLETQRESVLDIDAISSPDVVQDKSNHVDATPASETPNQISPHILAKQRTSEAEKDSSIEFANFANFDSVANSQKEFGVKPEDRSDEEMIVPLNSTDSDSDAKRLSGGPRSLDSFVEKTKKQTEKDDGSAFEIASVDDDNCWVANLEEHRALRQDIKTPTARTDESDEQMQSPVLDSKAGSLSPVLSSPSPSSDMALLASVSDVVFTDEGTASSLDERPKEGRAEAEEKQISEEISRAEEALPAEKTSLSKENEYSEVVEEDKAREAETQEESSPDFPVETEEARICHQEKLQADKFESKEKCNGEEQEQPVIVEDESMGEQPNEAATEKVSTAAATCVAEKEDSQARGVMCEEEQRDLAGEIHVDEEKHLGIAEIGKLEKEGETVEGNMTEETAKAPTKPDEEPIVCGEEQGQSLDVTPIAEKVQEAGIPTNSEEKDQVTRDVSRSTIPDVDMSEEEQKAEATPPVSGKKLIVLISTGVSGNRMQAKNQKRAILMIENCNFNVQPEYIDGADPANKERRNELFALSGIRGNYPQFFRSDGSEATFFGDFEAFEYMNNVGTLAEAIGAKPAFKAKDDARETETAQQIEEKPATAISNGNITLLVLISSMSGMLAQSTNQKRATAMLEIYNLEPQYLDGADPVHKERRNELFGISGIRGNYPQFFLVDEKSGTTFLGDFATIQSMHDSEMLGEVLQPSPSLSKTEHAEKEEENYPAPAVVAGAVILAGATTVARAMEDDEAVGRKTSLPDESSASIKIVEEAEATVDSQMETPPADEPEKAGRLVVAHYDVTSEEAEAHDSISPTKAKCLEEGKVAVVSAGVGDDAQSVSEESEAKAPNDSDQEEAEDTTDEAVTAIPSEAPVVEHDTSREALEANEEDKELASKEFRQEAASEQSEIASEDDKPDDELAETDEANIREKGVEDAMSAKEELREAKRGGADERAALEEIKETTVAEDSSGGKKERTADVELEIRLTGAKRCAEIEQAESGDADVLDEDGQVAHVAPAQVSNEQLVEEPCVAGMKHLTADNTADDAHTTEVQATVEKTMVAAIEDGNSESGEADILDEDGQVAHVAPARISEEQPAEEACVAGIKHLTEDNAADDADTTEVHSTVDETMAAPIVDDNNESGDADVLYEGGQAAHVARAQTVEDQLAEEACDAGMNNLTEDNAAAEDAHTTEVQATVDETMEALIVDGINKSGEAAVMDEDGQAAHSSPTKVSEDQLAEEACVAGMNNLTKDNTSDDAHTIEVQATLDETMIALIVDGIKKSGEADVLDEDGQAAHSSPTIVSEDQLAEEACVAGMNNLTEDDAAAEDAHTTEVQATVDETMIALIVDGINKSGEADVLDADGQAAHVAPAQASNEEPAEEVCGAEMNHLTEDNAADDAHITEVQATVEETMLALIVDGINKSGEADVLGADGQAAHVAPAQTSNEQPAEEVCGAEMNHLTEDNAAAEDAHIIEAQATVNETMLTLIVDDINGSGEADVLDEDGQDGQVAHVPPAQVSDEQPVEESCVVEMKHLTEGNAGAEDAHIIEVQATVDETIDEDPHTTEIQATVDETMVADAHTTEVQTTVVDEPIVAAIEDGNNESGDADVLDEDGQAAHVAPVQTSNEQLAEEVCGTEMKHLTEDNAANDAHITEVQATVEETMLALIVDGNSESGEADVLDEDGQVAHVAPAQISNEQPAEEVCGAEMNHLIEDNAAAEDAHIIEVQATVDETMAALIVDGINESGEADVLDEDGQDGQVAHVPPAQVTDEQPVEESCVVEMKPLTDDNAPAEDAHTTEVQATVDKTMVAAIEDGNKPMAAPIVDGNNESDVADAMDGFKQAAQIAPAQVSEDQRVEEACVAEMKRLTEDNAGAEDAHITEERATVDESMVAAIEDGIKESVEADAMDEDGQAAQVAPAQISEEQLVEEVCVAEMKHLTEDNAGAEDAHITEVQATVDEAMVAAIEDGINESVEADVLDGIKQAAQVAPAQISEEQLVEEACVDEMKRLTEDNAAAEDAHIIEVQATVDEAMVAAIEDGNNESIEADVLDGIKQAAQVASTQISEEQLVEEACVDEMKHLTEDNAGAEDAHITEVQATVDEAMIAAIEDGNNESVEADVLDGIKQAGQVASTQISEEQLAEDSCVSEMKDLTENNAAAEGAHIIEVQATVNESMVAAIEDGNNESVEADVLDEDGQAAQVAPAQMSDEQAADAACLAKEQEQQEAEHARLPSTEKRDNEEKLFEDVPIAEEEVQATIAEEMHIVEEAEQAQLEQETLAAKASANIIFADEKRVAEEEEEAPRIDENEEQARKYEEMRVAGEVQQARPAEEKGVVVEEEQTRVAEELRLTEAIRIAEEAEQEARIEEEKCLAEEEHVRIAEEARLAGKKAAKDAALAEEKCITDENIAGDKRLATVKAKRLAAVKAKEEATLAKEQRIFEELQLVRLVEAIRITHEAGQARLEEKRVAEAAATAIIAEEERTVEEEEEEEQARMAEESRLEQEIQQARLQEEIRLVEAEEARLADEKCLVGEESLLEERQHALLQEEIRMVEEAEEARLAEEKTLAEDDTLARIAEDSRREEEQQAREERVTVKNASEEARLAEEQQVEKAKEQEARIAVELRLAEEVHLTEENEKLRKEVEKRIAGEEEAEVAEEAKLVEEKQSSEEEQATRDADEETFLVEDASEEASIDGEDRNKRLATGAIVSVATVGVTSSLAKIHAESERKTETDKDAPRTNPDGSLKSINGMSTTGASEDSATGADTVERVDESPKPAMGDSSGAAVEFGGDEPKESAIAGIFKIISPSRKKDAKKVDKSTSRNIQEAADLDDQIQSVEQLMSSEASVKSPGLKAETAVPSTVPEPDNDNDSKTSIKAAVFAFMFTPKAKRISLDAQMEQKKQLLRESFNSLNLDLGDAMDSQMETQAFLVKQTGEGMNKATSTQEDKQVEADDGLSDSEAPASDDAEIDERSTMDDVDNRSIKSTGGGRSEAGNQAEAENAPTVGHDIQQETPNTPSAKASSSSAGIKDVTTSGTEKKELFAASPLKNEKRMWGSGVFKMLSPMLTPKEKVGKANPLDLERLKQQELLRGKLEELDLEDVMESEHTTQDFFVKQAMEAQLKKQQVADPLTIATQAESQDDVESESNATAKVDGVASPGVNKTGILDKVAGRVGWLGRRDDGPPGSLNSKEGEKADLEINQNDTHADILLLPGPEDSDDKEKDSKKEGMEADGRKSGLFDKVAGNASWLMDSWSGSRQKKETEEPKSKVEDTTKPKDEAEAQDDHLDSTEHHTNIKTDDREAPIQNTEVEPKAEDGANQKVAKEAVIKAQIRVQEDAPLQAEEETKMKVKEAARQKADADEEARQMIEEEAAKLKSREAATASDGFAIAINQEAEKESEFADASVKEDEGSNENKVKSDKEEEAAEEMYDKDKDFESGLLAEDANLSKQAKRINLLLQSMKEISSGERRLSKRDLLMDDDDDDLELEMERLNVTQPELHKELDTLKISSIDQDPDASPPSREHLKKTVQSNDERAATEKAREERKVEIRARLEARKQEDAERKSHVEEREARLQARAEARRKAEESAQCSE